MPILFRAALLGMALALAASAKTVDVAGENFTLEIPSTWSQSMRPDLLLFASDPSGASVLAVRKFPNESDQVIDTAFIRDVKQGMTEQGARIGTRVAIESQNPLTLGGAPAYLIQSSMIPPDSKSIAVRTYVIDVNDSFYILSLQTTDPAQDATLTAVADSFHFTQPPKLPVPDSDRLSYNIGRAAGTVLVIAVAWMLIQRLRSRRQAS